MRQLVLEYSHGSIQQRHPQSRQATTSVSKYNQPKKKKKNAQTLLGKLAIKSGEIKTITPEKPPKQNRRTARLCQKRDHNYLLCTNTGMTTNALGQED